MNPEGFRKTDGAHKVAFVTALALICAIGLWGLVTFLHYWKLGNDKAEAYSGLLAFFAATISSIVTVIYVYLTNFSLRAAQSSISLQREELDQMKASLALQQREWEQKVKVFPHFWVTAEGGKKYFVPDPQYPGGSRLLPMGFAKSFFANIWNYSEQSFLVESISVQRLDVCMIANQQTVEQQVVVKPHSVEKIELSYPIMRILTQTPLDNRMQGVMSKDVDNKALIGIRVQYADWSQKHARTELLELEFSFRPAEGTFKIQPPPKPSGICPSI